MKTRIIDGDKIRAVKYDLYRGYELVLAKDPTNYSFTISTDRAVELFTGDYLDKVSDNFKEINSPYYGKMKVWQETPLE